MAAFGVFDQLRILIHQGIESHQRFKYIKVDEIALSITMMVTCCYSNQRSIRNRILLQRNYILEVQQIKRSWQLLDTGPYSTSTWILFHLIIELHKAKKEKVWNLLADFFSCLHWSSMELNGIYNKMRAMRNTSN